MKTDEERLIKLENRFLDGEISEDTYKELKVRLMQRIHGSSENDINSVEIQTAHQFCKKCGAIIKENAFKCEQCEQVYCTNCRIKQSSGKILPICETCDKEEAANLQEKKRKDEAEDERISTTREPRYKLRSSPKAVPKEDADYEFSLKNYEPIEYIENDYENNGDGTVTDHATGLMWEQSGSKERLIYEEALTYIDILNHKRFAGYTDWRLPTLEELMSLLASGYHGNYNILSIDSVFDFKQQACWSADKLPPFSMWGLCFALGGAAWGGFDEVIYVRSVRSYQ